jgi:hypothetical protein
VGSSNAPGSGGGIVIGVILALTLALLFYWVLLIIGVGAALIAGGWYLWREKSPGTPAAHFRAWLAPRYHYPFVGLGSIVASVGGAFAIGELMAGRDQLLATLILTVVLFRALSMAWFPWPRRHPRGLSAYPLVAVTGPISSGLGILSVWMLNGAGHSLPQDSAGRVALSLTVVLAATALALLATAVGRVGREVRVGAAESRISMVDLLSPEACEAGRQRALSRNPLGAS